jgi:hypothetical protein
MRRSTTHMVATIKCDTTWAKSGWGSTHTFRFAKLPTITRFGLNLAIAVHKPQFY